MSEIAIKVEHLSKIYKLYDKPVDRMKEALSIKKKRYSRDHYALNDVSFEIKKGETVGIIGTNGSGKSTLLKIITGVLTQSSGSVIVNGKVSALLELGAGFNPEYTGLENIYLNGTMMGYTKEEMDERVEPIVEFADIGEFIHQPVKTYSSGMFVRLAFAVAVNIEPDILIIDEALAVGDIKFQTKCFSKIEEYNNIGKTIVMVSHDIDAIRKFCERILWVNSSNLIMDDTSKKVSSRYLRFLFDNDEKKNIDRVIKASDKKNLEINYMDKKLSFTSRWGSSPNLLLGARLNGKTMHQQILDVKQNIFLEISLCLTPQVLEKENLFLSTGIKNIKGQEILWCTTEPQMLYDAKSGDNIISFDINNILVPGQYSIVACLEYRDDYMAIKQPQYLDYIEGLFLFTINSTGKKTYSIVRTDYLVKLE